MVRLFNLAEDEFLVVCIFLTQFFTLSWVK